MASIMSWTLGQMKGTGADTRKRYTAAWEKGVKPLNAISLTFNPAKRMEQSHLGARRGKQWERSQREVEETSCNSRENPLTLRKVESHRRF